MTKNFISTLVGDDKLMLHKGLSDIDFGKANYSWRLMGAYYSSSFDRAGMKLSPIVRPETFSHPLSSSILGIDKKSMHLICKPIEQLRFLKGCKNIAVCGWEFESITTDFCPSDPFSNQLWQLQKADKVICWTSYTEKNLKKYGLKKAVTMPPAFEFRETNVRNVSVSREFTTLGAGCDVVGQDIRAEIDRRQGQAMYFSVLNPFDKRKCFRELIRGFLQFSKAKKDNCFLVVKLVIDDASTQLLHINDIMKDDYGELDLYSSDIYFVGDRLTEAAMSWLHQRADFYLCTSGAEGLNLPVIRSMMLGTAVISTHNSAMSDYLSADNSVKIDSQTKPAPKNISVVGERVQLEFSPPTLDQVADGLEKASVMENKKIKGLVEAARVIASDLFSQDRFEHRFRTYFGDMAEN